MRKMAVVLVMAFAFLFAGIAPAYAAPASGTATHVVKAKKHPKKGAKKHHKKVKRGHKKHAKKGVKKGHKKHHKHLKAKKAAK